MAIGRGLMRAATEFTTGFLGGIADQYADKKAKDDRLAEKLENLDIFEKQEEIKAGIQDKKNEKEVNEYLDLLAKDLGQGIDRDWFSIYAPIATTSVDNAKAWYSSLEQEFGFKPFNLVLAPEFGNISFKDFYESQYSTKNSSQSSQNKNDIAKNVGEVNNISDNTANVLLADASESASVQSDASPSYTTSAVIPFNKTAITGYAKKNRVNQQFFTHPDFGVVEAYQYETAPGSGIGNGIFYSMMQGDDGQFGQVLLNQAFFDQAQEGIANRTSKSYEFFDRKNNKHHVISGYEQGGVDYITGLPTSVASILNYKFFDKTYTPNYNVEDVLKEDFLGEDSTYKPFLMKLDDFNILFQQNANTDGLFRPVGSGTTTEAFATSQGDIKSLTEIFATTSNIATKDNFITIGEGVNATTQLRFVGGDARDLAGQQIGVLVAGMVDNHDKGNVPQETYDALNISSITSKNNLIANAGAYTSNFVNRIIRSETNALKNLKGEAFENYIINAGLNPTDYVEGQDDSITKFATDSAYKTVSNLPSIEAMIAMNNSFDQQETAAIEKAQERQNIENIATVNKYFPNQIEDFSSYVKEFVKDKGDEEQITMLLTDLRTLAETENDYNLLEAEAAKIVDGLPDFGGKGPDSEKQKQAIEEGTTRDAISNLAVAPEYPPRVFGESKEVMDQNKKDREEWKDTYGDFFFEDGSKKTALQIEAIANGRSENNTKLYVDTENYKQLNSIE